MVTPANEKKQVAVRCLQAWTSGDFAGARGLLADDVTFVGPLAKTTGADEYIMGVRGFVAAMVKGVEVHQVIADGDDVCVTYDLVTKAGAVPTVGWYRIREGKVASVKAFFDPRPLMGDGQASGASGETKTAAGAPPKDKAAIQARPPGYHAVTPWIIARDAGKLIDFMKAAFGAAELVRMDMDGRVVHAEVRVEDSVVMMFDARPEWPDTPGFLRLYVADADAVFERALGAGATAVTRVAELAFGDRVGRVRDPLGNLWWIQTHVRDASPREMQHPSPTQAQAMQDAMSTLDRELASRARPGR